MCRDTLTGESEHQFSNSNYSIRHHDPRTEKLLHGGLQLEQSHHDPVHKIIVFSMFGLSVVLRIVGNADFGPDWKSRRA